ncbi:MAG: formate/nitrite transporter family protein [Nitrospiraceae bacterium]
MHQSDITRIAEQSQAKAAYLEGRPMGYLILSALAGVYLGFGITLIFSVDAPFAAEGAAAQKLVMGAAFGVALALVIFAGSELFTGNNMICVIGALTRVISWGALARIFAVSLLGSRTTASTLPGPRLVRAALAPGKTGLPRRFMPTGCSSSGHGP